MKRLLLVSFAFIICIAFEMEVSANPAINVRQKPAFPKTQGFVESESVDQYYYLFNVDAQAFFTEGNAWGTQVSLGATGLRVAFVPEGTAYLFNDYSLAKNAWKFAFFDTENRMYVDLGSQANYRWGVEDNGATFRLFAADEEAGNPGFGDDKPAYREGMYVGWVKGSNSTACVPYLPVADENCINWAFVTEEDYLPYEEAILVYNAAETLKAILEEAEGLGANIAAQLEVYNNLSSTIEELNSAGEDIKPIIEARKNLKKELDEAKAAGFTEIVDADAVYFNGDATKAQLEKALTDLIAAFLEWGKTHATVANPANMTSKIVNPNYDNASYTGWSGTAPNMVGSGSHGPANVPEIWNATFDHYQDVVELPAGVYELGAQTYWHGSWNDMVNKIGPASKLYATVGDTEYSTPFNYAYGPLNTESMAGDTPWGVGASEQSHTDEETGITYYIPNNPSCFRLYAEKGLYDTKVLFGADGGSVRIGVKNPQKMGDADNLSFWDTFTLTYYGSGADAAQLYVDESLKNFSEITIPEGTVYTESYLTAYQEALAGDKTANSYDEAVVIINAIRDSKKAIDKNIELWQTWQKNLEDAYAKYATDEMFSNMLATGVLTDYYEKDEAEDGGPGKETILAEHNLTNEQLEAEIARIAAMCEAIEKEAKEGLEPGTDVTKFIANPDFEGGVKSGVDDSNGHTGAYGTAVGWHADKFANGLFSPGPDGKDNDPTVNHSFEAWHCKDFDLWQEVTNLPEGVYVMEVQGFVRCEASGYTKGDELTNIPIKLYMNNATSDFKDVYSEQVPKDKYDAYGNLPVIESWSWTSDHYPNSIGAAGLCFDWGMYKVQTFGLVKAGESMRIGVKGKMNSDWWCVWDNFKLTYQGYDVNYVLPALEDAMTQINSNQSMGKSLYAQALGLEAKAAEAKASGDGKTMFNVLADIYDLSVAIRNSVDLFTSMLTAADNLNNAAYLSENATAKAEVVALAAEIKNGIASHSYEDAEVEGLLEQIAKATTKLYMPEDMASASDANPVECTKVIKTPAFENEEDYTNSSEGWTGAGNLGNDDTQKSVLAMEFWQEAFDMYQTIVGLPKGTYKLTVDAWCRAGSNEENYAGWQANHRYTMASLYAIDGNNTVYSAPIANMMKGMMTENPGIDGVDEIMLGGKNYWVPNSQAGGRCYIDVVEEGTYTNSLICKVGDDGKLTVGIKKPEQKNNSWVVLDNFRLYYYGPNSTKQVSDGSTPDDDDTPDDSNVSNISFVDVNVKAICVENWDTDGDGELSEDEAAMVKDIGTLFRDNSEITSFNEMVYFIGIDNIADDAFVGCSNLTSVIIPNSVTNIGAYAFAFCSGLTSITIPNSVTSIGEGAFYNCSSLTSITIPNFVTSIGEGAFVDCSNLTSMMVESGNTVYDSRDNCNAIIRKSDNELVTGCKSTTIPNSVTSIGNCSFYGCNSLTSITIPNSVTSIGNKAFFNCSGMTSITIPNSVTSIGYSAFGGCSGLTSITIPNSVTSIGEGAFSGCNGLTSVTVENTTPIAINYSCFSNRANATLYVPKGSKAAYEAADYWKEFKEIIESEPENTPKITLDFTLADANDSKVSLWGFPSGSTEKLVEEKSFTYGGYTIKVAGSEGQGYYWHNKDHYLLFGKQGATVTLPAFDFDVERIDIEGNPSASSRVLQNIYVGETAVSTETEGAQGTNIFYIAADYQAAGNVYVIKVTSSHNNQIRSIKIWKKGTSEVTIPEEPEEPIATTEEVLKVEDVTANKEQTVSVDICLDNKKTDLTAYQFDLTLPAGITLAKNDKDKFQVTKTGRYEDESQSLSVSLLEENTYRIVSFSLSNGTIEGTSGAILNAVLAIDRNVADGTYKAQITNIIFTKVDSKQLKLADTKFDIVVNNMVKGDANGDGEINVSDIVELVNYILGKAPAGFVFLAADLNGDGEVNVTDIVMVVNIIMAGNGSGARSIEGKADGLTDNDYLRLIGNEDGRMSLCLDNQGSYVASQFDLRLSDGQVLKDIKLNGNRMAGHQVAYTQIGEGLYRVIVYSLSNEEFNDQTGELLNFDIAGAGTVSVENILFVTARQTERRFASLQSVTTGIMAVKALTSDNDQWFDLQGRRVTESAKKGVYINKGKKLVVR